MVTMGSKLSKGQGVWVERQQPQPVRFLLAFLVFCALYKIPESSAQLIQAAPERCFVFSDVKACGCRSERTLGANCCLCASGIGNYQLQQTQTVVQSGLMFQ